MKSTLLTHSRLKDARACRRLHHFKYEHGFRPTEDRAELAFGTLMHRGLEAWWSAIRAESDAEAAVGVFLDGLEIDPFDLAKLRVLLTGYHARWLDAAAEYEVLGVEERFSFPLVNPATGARSPVWTVGGKLDVRLRRRSDLALVLMEHKTSAEDVTLGSSYWQRLRMDGQISIYFDGTAALGEPAAVCIYDVIGKPSIRPLKATPEESRKYTKAGALYANQRESDETPEEFTARLMEAVGSEPERYFVRGDVVRLEADMEEARTDIWQYAAMLREEHNAGRAPRNPDACTAYGRPCPFFAVCSGAASLDDETLFYRTDEVHPELAGAPSEQTPKEEAHP